MWVPHIYSSTSAVKAAGNLKAIADPNPNVKWYNYLLQHPMTMLGLFGMVLIFIALAGSENFDFWIFKKLKLDQTTRIISFITGIVFILCMILQK